MKFVLVTMVVLFAGCMAELAKPEEKIIHPDTAFTSAWNFQRELEFLQDDINAAVKDVVAALSGVLKESSETALHRFQDHTEDLIALFEAPMASFESLKESDCKDRAKALLDSTLEFIGYEGGICSGDYNIDVDKQIEAAQKVLYEFDDLYSQVLMIPGKSFIAHNVFLDGEVIGDKINATTKAITERWIAQKPQLEAIRANLATNIRAVYDNKLVPCNLDTIDFATVSHLPIFSRMVNNCVALETPAARSDRFGAPAGPEASEAIYQEFLALNEQWKVARGHSL